MSSRRQLANAIRALSMDAVQQANSGHPGMPLGMADIAEVLWNDFLRHNPANPSWVNRDRFVLSNGHGSMLLYALLHLSGYDLSIDDLRDFRQLHSKTPGHPEYGYAPGIETTTGPLGQGIANAVGMALAERTWAAQFNRPDHKIVDHHTYVFLGDGCLMEGISHEVCSLAGTLGLGKLIALYDDNGISIDGAIAGWFADDTAQRFQAYGWHVIDDIDGHDATAVQQALQQAREVTDRPSLLCCKTVIGFGSPNKAGSEGAHGAPLGIDEITATRKQLDWPYEPFVIPNEIYSDWNKCDQGAVWESDWQQRFEAYREAYPELAAEFERRCAGELPADWQQKSQAFINASADKGEAIASRAASQNTLNAYAPVLPELFGGSADLTHSNNTVWQGSVAVNEQADGNYLYYGVREFGMAAIMNGMALYGGFIPYGGTFLVFSDYARNAIRMAAIMQQRSIMVLTHDSVGLGEDGPTHQPVEHLASLRLIPNVTVWRPCDAVESAVAWKAAIEHDSGPSCLVFSRQKLTHQTRDDAQIAAIERGGYIVQDCAEAPQAIVIATGSEVALAMQAAAQLNDKGYQIRIVSMPSVNVFAAQDADYRESVLPSSISKRIVVEAGASAGWYQYVGLEGKVVGLDRFGESAPGDTVFAHLGFTVENVVQHIESIL